MAQQAPPMSTRVLARIIRGPRDAYFRWSIQRALSSIDHVLASYPKSGRTWLRYILSYYFVLAFGLDCSVDLHQMFSLLPNLDWDADQGLPAFVGGPAIGFVPLLAATHERPRLFRHHDVPAIYMTRDVRDVLVSSYFHATRHKCDFQGDIDAFVRDRSRGLHQVAKHYNSWASYLSKVPHRVISYESLSSDPQTTVSNALAFLNLEPSTPLIAQAVAAAEIGKMRSMEVAAGLPGHRYDRSDPEALRVRRGLVGGYGDYLSVRTCLWIHEEWSKAITPEARDLLGASLEAR
jgi:alcohol sulfotransferase